MPSFLGAPPRRFRRPALLIAGCGDVGLRVARLLGRRWRLLALTSTPARRDTLRAAGCVPLCGDLDRPATLQRLAGLADALLHLAPPPAHGDGDPRTVHLLHALARRGATRRIVYASTTGVYGDAGGERFDETRKVAPATDRARRRVAAEARVRARGRAFGATACVLRMPGIYAFDRAGGDPRERVARRAPLLERADDVYTNHIHADDLARACLAALVRGAPQRIYHVCDDDEAAMGEWYDRVADLAGLPRAPRLARAAAASALTPAQLSFLGESRRLVNRRLRRELRLALRYPRVEAAFAQMPRG